MKIQRMRVYCEVYEQGLETKNYLTSVLREKRIDCEIDIVYTKKIRGEFLPGESLLTRIRKIKDIDITVSAISGNAEIPIVLIEYSTAVPTDDHIMQRSDVMYWSAVFKIPSIKISPLNKGMSDDHGGGDKITDEFEKRVALGNNAVYYTVKWLCDEENGILLTDENRLSCMPYSEMLRSYFLKITDFFLKYDSHAEYFEELLKDYKRENATLLKALPTDEVKKIFPPSKRFTWTDEGLRIKINRFGHALDPDRGVIYFCNMMNGTVATFAEFQVERASVYGRGGYHALFDMTTTRDKMIEYVSRLGKTFSADDAKYVFFEGLGIGRYFKNTDVVEGVVKLDDEELREYLKNASGFALKSVFILSENIVLTDRKRKTILTLKYNRSVIDEYLSALNAFTYDVTKIKQLESNDINEDIVTYASMQLLRNAGMKILAVSYPGAQGDRCMLIGKGRNVKREYIDLIAYDNDKENSVNVILHESKDRLAKSATDIRKLDAIARSEMLIDSLKKLFGKIIGKEAVSEIHIGIGGKDAETSSVEKLDYVMLFDAERNGKCVDVLWEIEVINKAICERLEPLLNEYGELRGRIELGELYRIK